MEGLIIAIFLGWIGGYRFYKKQYGLFILYLFTCGLFGIGWLIDIICSISDLGKADTKQKTSQSQKTNEIYQGKTLRVFTIKQSDLLKGFEKLQVSSHYEPIQEDIKTLRIPDSSDQTHPYKIDLGDSDIEFREMEYRAENGLECFQIYSNGHHIGTLFDSEDNNNRFYIQALIHNKVDAVHVEINPRQIYGSDQTDFEYETKLWMHLKG